MIIIAKILNVSGPVLSLSTWSYQLDHLSQRNKAEMEKAEMDDS